LPGAQKRRFIRDVATRYSIVDFTSALAGLMI
jgi:hypothetical protein